MERNLDINNRLFNSRFVKRVKGRMNTNWNIVHWFVRVNTKSNSGNLLKSVIEQIFFFSVVFLHWNRVQILRRCTKFIVHSKVKTKHTKHKKKKKKEATTTTTTTTATTKTATTVWIRIRKRRSENRHLTIGIDQFVILRDKKKIRPSQTHT